MLDIITHDVVALADGYRRCPKRGGDNRKTRSCSCLGRVENTAERASIPSANANGCLCARGVHALPLVIRRGANTIDPPAGCCWRLLWRLKKTGWMCAGVGPSTSTDCIGSGSGPNQCCEFMASSAPAQPVCRRAGRARRAPRPPSVPDGSDRSPAGRSEPPPQVPHTGRDALPVARAHA
jgi:hypothetical protein